MGVEINGKQNTNLKDKNTNFLPLYEIPNKTMHKLVLNTN